jgi:hypothetical protein
MSGKCWSSLKKINRGKLYVSFVQMNKGKLHSFDLMTLSIKDLAMGCQ